MTEGYARRGFTLIEVLLATALLAAALALAFATLHAAGAIAQRGEQLSANSEQMRAVEGFLRRRLGASLPIAYATVPDTGEQLRFTGEADRIRFVADLPDYLGRGGPYLHDVRVLGDGAHAQLTVAFTVVAADQTWPEREPRAPDVLVEDLQSLRLRYRGIGPDGRMGEWQDTWDAPGQMPMQVSVEIATRSGGRWPPMVVALPQAGATLPGAGGLFR